MRDLNAQGLFVSFFLVTEANFYKASIDQLLVYRSASFLGPSLKPWSVYTVVRQKWSMSQECILLVQIIVNI